MRGKGGGSPAVTVVGDPELLRRAIENVIRNAIRHAPESTAVEAGLEAADGRATVRIRDYGPGVPEEALPRIFDAFYRVETDRDRASGGAGLGLSIARRAVELHKGTIRARNAEPGLAVEMTSGVAWQQFGDSIITASAAHRPCYAIAAPREGGRVVAIAPTTPLLRDAGGNRYGTANGGNPGRGHRL